MQDWCHHKPPSRFPVSLLPGHNEWDSILKIIFKNMKNLRK
ncbi:conserved domain protein [Paenibacillus sp. HGF5]|nr:conserved domain protein [Paenibacillus sp. HGF5]